MFTFAILSFWMLSACVLNRIADSVWKMYYEGSWQPNRFFNSIEDAVCGFRSAAVSFVMACTVSTMGIVILLVEDITWVSPLIHNAVCMLCSSCMLDITLNRVSKLDVTQMIHHTICFALTMVVLTTPADVEVIRLAGWVLLYEISTPFLALVWFERVQGRDGAIWKRLAFAVTFLICRVGFGLMVMIDVIYYRAEEIDKLMGCTRALQFFLLVLFILQIYWAYLIMWKIMKFVNKLIVLGAI